MLPHRKTAAQGKEEIPILLLKRENRRLTERAKTET